MRWLPPLSMLLAIGSLACSTPGPAPMTEPTTEPARVEPARVGTDPAELDRSSPPSAEYFFANLSQDGVENCPDGELTWLAVTPTLGWIPTSGVDEATLEPLMDLPVLARGQAGPAPERPPLDVTFEMCPQRQMRSDWEHTPRGMRVHRTQTPAIPHFHAISVRRLDELRVTREGEAIVVSFENPLPFALDAVTLEVHYEGCYGKPGALTKRSATTSLAPGQALSERFWLIAEHGQPTPARTGSRSGVHRAASVVVNIEPQRGAEGAAVHADLDVSLAKLGVDFECP